ncbi:MAG: HNH endonuclease [bacterium]|nr:HNH endonuclease [bacterium]
MTKWDERRQAVFRLDKRRCLRCGSDSDSELRVDHILPEAADGKGGWKNLQTLCQPCNHLKGDRYIDYRTDERSRKADDKSDSGQQTRTALEKLAAATGALDKARLEWYDALSAAVTAGHPQQDVAAAAGMSSACAPPRTIRQEIDGQPLGRS